MFQLYASEQSDCYESVLLGSIDQQHFAKTQGNQKRSVNEAVHMRQSMPLFLPLPCLTFTFYNNKNKSFQTSWDKDAIAVRALKDIL